MSKTDINTVRRLPVQLATRPENVEAVRMFAETIAAESVRRALLAALGRAAA
ncbi:MAG: hypothetical protein VX796_09230 [Pseudomonadota bacterium]|nr:hypothetical protein [Pseudomonadota bacterium]